MSHNTSSNYDWNRCAKNYHNSKLRTFTSQTEVPHECNKIF